MDVPRGFRIDDKGTGLTDQAAGPAEARKLDRKRAAATTAEIATAIAAAIAAHLAAVNPHPEYLTQIEADALYQAGSAVLTALAALTGAANDDVIQKKAGAFTNRTLAQLAADLQAAALDALYLKLTGGTLSGTLSITVAGAGASVDLTSEGTTQVRAARDTPDAVAPEFALRKARGTTASRVAVALSDVLGRLRAQAYGASAYQEAGDIRFISKEPVPSNTAMGTYVEVRTASLAGVTLVARVRFDDTGISDGSGNVMLDASRGVQLRSTTIAGAVTPATAGRLFHHSNAQDGAGETCVDTGSAYRHAGQAGIKRVTSNAGVNYTPRLDGRIIRDTATLTANRNLTLLATNVTDGHVVEVSRRGSSGGFTRDVKQADGTTAIVSLADNASARFCYDATAALWFQL